MSEKFWVAVVAFIIGFGTAIALSNRPLIAPCNHNIRVGVYYGY